MKTPAIDKTIQGIDISKWQGNVDFDKVRESGMRFVYVKATEGQKYRDPRFAEHWDELEDQAHFPSALYRGAYHFARPSSDGSPRDAMLEAKDFAAALSFSQWNAPGVLPPALDFEEYSDNGPAENVPWIRSFIETIKIETGRTPVIYAGVNVWRWEVGSSDTDFWNALPLWVARPTSQRDIDPLTRGGYKLPWDAWTLWQWSQGAKLDYHGPVPGVTGACDVNRFAGTEADLAALAGIKPTEDDLDAPIARSAAFADAMHMEKLQTMHAFHHGEATRIASLIETCSGKAPVR